MLDRNGEEKKQGTPATSSTRVSVVWDHENSTGFDADTSKVEKPFFSFFFNTKPTNLWWMDSRKTIKGTFMESNLKFLNFK